MTSKCAGLMNEQELNLGEKGNSGMAVPGWNGILELSFYFILSIDTDINLTKKLS